MPRRRASSRQALAFDALVGPDDDDETSRGNVNLKNSRKKPARRCSAASDVKVPGFALREDSTSASASILGNEHWQNTEGHQRAGANDGIDSIHYRNESNVLNHLKSVFGDALDHDIIEDVFDQCNGCLNASTEALLGMADFEESKYDLLRKDPMRTIDSENVASDKQPLRDRKHDNSQTNSLWHSLPREVKELVFEHLEMKEKSRLACTCKDFAYRLAMDRSSASVVRIPVSMTTSSAAAAIVRSYCKATTVVIRHHDEDSNVMFSIISGIAQGALDRLDGSYREKMVQRVRYYADDSLSVTKCTSSCIMPVTKLVFLHKEVHESVIEYACSSIPTLRALVSKSSYVNDKTLLSFAKYRRDPDVEFLYGEAMDSMKSEGSGSQMDCFGSMARVQTRDSLEDTKSAPCINGEDEVGSNLERSMTSMNISNRSAIGTDLEQFGHDSDTMLSSFQTPGFAASTGSSIVSVGMRNANCQMEHSIMRMNSNRETKLGLPGLEEVSIIGSADISNAGVRNFLLQGPQRIPSLKYLHLSNCKCIHEDGLRIHINSVLEHIHINSLPRLKEISWRLPGSSLLREISLTNCKSLIALDLSAPQLQSLNVSGCKNLQKFDEIRCPKLETFNASHCALLTFNDLDAFVCPNLKNLSLHSCRSIDIESVRTLAANLANLWSIDLSGCTSLYQVNLCTILPSGMLQLRTMRVDGCSNLRSLQLTALPALQEFSASGCVGLRHLSLPGARPRYLKLRNCRALHEVYIGGGDNAVESSSTYSYEMAFTPSYIEDNQSEGQSEAMIDLKGTDNLSKDMKSNIIAAVKSGGHAKNIIVYT